MINKSENAIPARYENLPADVVEGLMKYEPMYNTEEKNNEASMRRQAILAEIRQREIDSVKANEVRKKLGLSEVSSEAVEPESGVVEFEAINENKNIARSPHDQNIISAEQRGDSINYKYGAADWFQFKGRLAEQEINGEKVRIAINTETPAHAAYQPMRGDYEMGAGAIAEYRQDPDMFYSSVNHEAAHKEYFNLIGADQKELTDLFLSNSELNQLLRQFAEALYGDRMPFGNTTGGEQYLGVHDIKNAETAGLIVSEGQRGIKDDRSAVFELNGQSHEILLGLLVTELVSLTSSLQMGDDVFKKVSEKGKNLRGGKDPRYDVARKVFDRIRGDSNLKKKFDSFGLFKNNNEKFLEAFREVVENA
jgi:hypothetical protein